MRLPILMLAFLFAVAAAAPRAPFKVLETGARYVSLQDAVDVIGDGEGTIEIEPGTYRVCAVQQEGRVAFRAAKPGAVVLKGGICEDKATLVLRGQAARIEGLTFTGTFVEDGNGAGIRLERGDLEVRQAKFHDAQSGILTADDPAGSIAIDRSTFAGLGKHPDGRGAHSVYVGNYGTLKVTNSRFEEGTGGHYLKSRAAWVELLDSSFDDSRGRGTLYLLDLSNGATGRIAGNAFVQGRDKENYAAMIAVAAEGRVHPSAGLAIENNRAWVVPRFPFVTSFVATWTDEPLIVRDNEIAARIQPLVRR